MAQETQDDPKTIKAQCSNCGGERNCTVHGHVQQNGESQDINWWIDWRLLQCRGCDNVFFQKASSDSESHIPVGMYNGEYVYDYDYAHHYWPPLAKRKRPEWMNYVGKNRLIPGDLEDTLEELYSALDNDLKMLSGIAIRTSFDVAAGILGVEAEHFNQKLAELVSKNFLNINDRDNVQSIIDAGNASVHRGWTASIEELDTMMEILESFIQGAFVEPTKRRLLDEKAAKIKAGVPKRERKKKHPKGSETPEGENSSA